MDNIIINIGYNCASNDILKNFNLKTYSYPFDTKLVYEIPLINCLKDDFIDFMNEEYFTLFIDRECPVNKYGIALNHIFPFDETNENDNDYFSITDVEQKLNLKFCNFIDDKIQDYKYNLHTHVRPRILCSNYLDFLPDLKIKFNRRINRFKDAMLSNNNIYLFRNEKITKESCIEIYNILIERYPKVNLKIIAISKYDDKFKENWNHKNILNYFIDKDNEQNELLSIFTNIGLI
jgi:hypothetical protein